MGAVGENVGPDMAYNDNAVGHEATCVVCGDDGNVVGHESEYQESYDIGSFDDEKGIEKTVVRRKSIRPKYKPSSIIPKREIVMTFNNANQFKQVVKQYAVQRGMQLRFKKNETGKVRVVCVDKYPWIRFTSKNNTEHKFQIKSYNSVHKCYRTHK